MDVLSHLNPSLLSQKVLGVISQSFWSFKMHFKNSISKTVGRISLGLSVSCYVVIQQAKQVNYDTSTTTFNMAPILYFTFAPSAVCHAVLFCRCGTKPRKVIYGYSMVEIEIKASGSIGNSKSGRSVNRN